jgi:hypothetical protein
MPVDSSKQLQIYTSAQVKAKVKEMAQGNGISISSYVESLILKDLQRKGITLLSDAELDRIQAFETIKKDPSLLEELRMQFLLTKCFVGY